MLDYRAICLSACDLAREAGAYIAEQRKSFTFADVEFKGAQNLVSYVDKQTEKMIVERLRELTPDAGFITEEGTVTAAVEGQPLKWITGRDKMLRLLCRICLFLLTRPLRDVTNLSGSSDR